MSAHLYGVKFWAGMEAGPYGQFFQGGYNAKI